MRADWSDGRGPIPEPVSASPADKPVPQRDVENTRFIPNSAEVLSTEELIIPSRDLPSSSGSTPKDQRGPEAFRGELPLRPGDPIQLKEGLVFRDGRIEPEEGFYRPSGDS